MLRKDNSIYYALVMLVGIITLYFKSDVLLVFLMAFLMLAWFIKDINHGKSIMEVKANFKQKEELALERADDANIKLKQLINAIPSPLVYMNQSGGFEVSNVPFDAMLKRVPENVYDSQVDSPLRHIMLDAFLNEQQFIRQLDYQDIEYQVHSIPIISEKRYQGCLMIFQDVTQIARGESIQKQFIADASHELKTPITSIKGMIEIMNRPNFNDDEIKKEFSKQVAKETQRLNLMVKDLLLQSKLRENRIYLEKTNFNLKNFFEEFILENRKPIGSENMSVTLDCPRELNLYADEFRLTQVFTNLLNNAMLYALQGSVTIDCHLIESMIRIEFSDNGKGIKEELLPHIFDRFYRVESDRNRNLGGSGLGLAISKSIVEAHGGTMTVESLEGQGTRFIINLTQA